MLPPAPLCIEINKICTLVTESSSDTSNCSHFKYSGFCYSDDKSALPKKILSIIFPQASITNSHPACRLHQRQIKFNYTRHRLCKFPHFDPPLPLSLPISPLTSHLPFLLTSTSITLPYFLLSHSFSQDGAEYYHE
jgi:hypothetical protein